VLCIDAIEIATAQGHVVAVGLDKAAPYPLGGEPRDVIEDVARLGGMSVAAHPTSAKPALRWRDWETDFDGLEWLNADSEWRDERPLTLLAALATYPFRSAATLTSLLDRPTDVLAHWDQLLQHRRVVAIAGADAHASLVNGEDNPYSDRSPVALPAYEQSFRTFSLALPTVQLTGDAGMDARHVVDAIRAGHLYTAIDGLAHPARFSFTARSGVGQAQAGETLPRSGEVTIDVRTNAPAGGRVVLIHDGRIVATAGTPSLTFTGGGTEGYYRVEVYAGGTTKANVVPWIVSNPIYIGNHTESAPAFRPTTESVLYRDALPGDGWGIEKKPEASSPTATTAVTSAPAARSHGLLDVQHERGQTRLLVEYTLGGTRNDNPYVALAMPAGSNLAAYDHLAFRGRADRPTRIWVQFWRPVPAGNQYWRRSVYLDPLEREIVVPFAEMRPAEPGTPARVPLPTIVTVPFVY
jgi:hypothetical protein